MEMGVFRKAHVSLYAGYAGKTVSKHRATGMEFIY